MTQDTWAYVTCNAGRVEYSIFDARDTRVAHGAVALSEFSPHEPKDVLRSLDVSFAVLDGAFAGQRVTCPASLAAPIEIGGQFARMARFIDNSAPDQCFAHSVRPWGLCRGSCQMGRDRYFRRSSYNMGPCQRG